MWVYLLLLAIPATAWGSWKAAKDYRIYGKLRAVGLVSALFMFLVPHLVLGSVMTYGIPRTPVDAIGVALGVLGLGLCLSGMVAFRSAKKSFGLDARWLTVAGPYRWSRNPQYVGWGMAFLGFALIGWTTRCLIPLILYALVVHLLVRGEEKHLERVFGDEYRAYCRRTPRYFGWRSVRL
jgi:protein-S-isoprenylcysteine O-methyltransferase Ste14